MRAVVGCRFVLPLVHHCSGKSARNPQPANKNRGKPIMQAKYLRRARRPLSVSSDGYRQMLNQFHPTFDGSTSGFRPRTICTPKTMQPHQQPTTPTTHAHIIISAIVLILCAQPTLPFRIAELARHILRRCVGHSLFVIGVKVIPQLLERHLRSPVLPPFVPVVCRIAILLP